MANEKIYLTKKSEFESEIQRIDNDIEALDATKADQASVEELGNDKQDKLTAGEGIVITSDNIISATGGSGEPDAYIKNIESAGNVYTATKKDGSTIAWTIPSTDTLATKTELETEATTRADVDSTLSGAIANETTEREAADTDLSNRIDEKSTVSVSSTGTAIDEVSYITIDGVERKLASDSKSWIAGDGIEFDGETIKVDRTSVPTVIDTNLTGLTTVEGIQVTDGVEAYDVLKSQSVQNVVTLTKEEYEALETKDPATLYCVTND